MPLIVRYRNAFASHPVQPEVALIVSTYQRPRHLRLALTSIALQQAVSGKFELVITDDGSTDTTFELVEQYAATVDFPVTLTTHKHGTFQLAKCRNEGVAASTARYLIFTDGDLILPSDFIFQHLKRRRNKTAFSGESYRLAEEASAGIDEDAVRSGTYRSLVSPADRARVRKVARRARWHALIRHPNRPRLIGWNVGIWRSDYELVNGYDERFQGWGCEDDDLTHRLRGVGVRTRWINRWTCAYHVWHPRDATAPAVWADGANIAYYQRKDRENRCLDGLIKLHPSDESSLAEPPPTEWVAALPFRPAEPKEGRRRSAA